MKKDIKEIIKLFIPEIILIIKRKLFNQQTVSKELFDGSVWAWEETYSIKNITERITKAGTNIPLSLITNLGYRYYGNRLRNFPNETIIDLEEKWNKKLL